LASAETLTNPYTIDSYPVKKEESTMHNNPNTDAENPPLDAEDWEIAFQPYAEHSSAALGLARHFSTLREYLHATPPDTPRALAAIDQAIESLYPHTGFDKGAHELYRVLIEGKATRAQEVQIENLGVKF
jgi:hypothetical protein